MLKLLGATENDLEEARGICENMNPDPYLDFRDSSMYRIILDFSRRIISRAVREPFVLTAKDGFVRKDSGVKRFFGEPQHWIMQNTAWQALMRWKAFMMSGTATTPRSGCDPERNWNQAGFFLRVKTTDDLLGEPASEGVHLDGVEFTMTTLFNSRNMAEGSAQSSLYSLNQEPGVQAKDADPSTNFATVEHRDFLDTLLIIDNQMYHSVGALNQAKPGAGPALRDMGVFFTRRMCKPGEGFSSDGYDSEDMHPELPFAMSMSTPFFPKM